jgi:hypothetical protein
METECVSCEEGNEFLLQATKVNYYKQHNVRPHLAAGQQAPLGSGLETQTQIRNTQLGVRTHVTSHPKSI